MIYSNIHNTLNVSKGIMTWGPANQWEVGALLLEGCCVVAVRIFVWGMTNPEIEGLICDFWVGWRIELGNLGLRLD